MVMPVSMSQNRTLVVGLEVRAGINSPVFPPSKVRNMFPKTIDNTRMRTTRRLVVSQAEKVDGIQ